MESRYHFAYADNMDEDNAHVICPGATFEGVAELRDYRLTFTSQGRATLVAETGNTVWGVVWCLSNRDIHLLDNNEDEYLPDYRRTPVKVRFLDQRTIGAFCYVNVNPGESAPDNILLMTMIESAEFWGLPAGHIAYLKSLIR
jgi:gamma-glutamylcyclotransferase (GGCT)/AIG2-like uncharacterized protein YtfP